MFHILILDQVSASLRYEATVLERTQVVMKSLDQVARGCLVYPRASPETSRPASTRVDPRKRLPLLYGDLECVQGWQ